MKPYKFVWSTHRWIGVVAALVLLNSAITGFFLLVKKDYAWIQPPTQSGSEGNIADFISFQELSTVIEQLQHPDFSDANAIDRIDVRPAKNVFKVRSVHNHTEVQVDAINGRVLGVASRRSDFFEALHDGSWYGSWAHDLLMPVTAVAVMLLVGTGLYLWLKRALLPRRKKQKKRGRLSKSSEKNILAKSVTGKVAETL